MHSFVHLQKKGASKRGLGTFHILEGGGTPAEVVGPFWMISGVLNPKKKKQEFQEWN